MEKERINMSRKQLKAAHVMRKYNEGLMSRKATAEALGLSERQITRLGKGMREEGETALIHKNTGRKPSHALSNDVKERIIKIRDKEGYTKCNHQHFQELLERNHGIIISYSALYKLLKEAGVESPKKRRQMKKHRRRKRKAHFGELLQLDATPYDWFELGTKQAMHASIDDATGKITGLYMTENECLQGYFSVMRQTIIGYGVPLSAYSDKHTIFRSPLTEKKQELGEEANLTQFGRALSEFGINLIHAHSPQAKGRVERLWETLQSRLPVEFKLKGITTIEAANRFLAEEFIDIFNNQFSVEAEAESIFVPYTHPEKIDDILCVKETRKTDNAGNFSFRGQRFKVLDEGYPLIPAKAEIDVLVNMSDSVRVRYKNRVFNTVINTSVEKKKVTPRKSAVAERQVKPHLRHGSNEWKKVWHFEDFDETLAYIYEIFFKPSA
jgi:transposase